MRAVCRLVASALVVAFPVVDAGAQEKIASKQEQARLKFQDLHDRMLKLEMLLAGSAPDDSRVLKVGNRFIQEVEIHEDMADVQRFITEESWDQALTKMDDLRGELTQLMDLLLNRDTDLQKLLEKIEEWQRFKDRLDGLIDDQQAEKDAAARTEALEKHLRDLEQARQKVEQLILDQRDLRDETNQAGMAAAPQAAQQLGDRQEELKQSTEAFAEELAQIEKDSAELNNPGEEKAGAAPPGGEPSKPKEGNPAGGSPGSPGSCSGSASSAASSMGKSQQKLQQNKPESSLQDQDQALDQLAGLREQLEQLSDEARRKLLELPFEQQFRAQEATRIDTDTLAGDMEQAESADGNAEPSGAPGAENVQQAVPKQKSAAGMLKERKAGQAKQKQQDAKEELEAAQRKLEEALAQLRQQLQDEVLRSLEERFGAMLAWQKELSADTKAVDRLRQETLTATGALPASLAARSEEISDGESSLAAEAGSALQLLEEEGTTAAFPAIVEMLQEDLERVAQRLGDYKTGRGTQKNQADIEETLRDLINALRRQIEDGESKGAGESDGQPPLVPMSAELKLIQLLQKRVAARTKTYDAEIPQQLRVTDEAADEALEISRKQGQVEDLTRRIAEKLNKENQTGRGR